MANDDSFDFKKIAELPDAFAADYLRQYYGEGRPVSDDEIAVYKFIRQIAPKLSGNENAIEVGCGPTLHHAIMLAPYIKTLTMSDYLEQNLEFVQSWLEKGSVAWNWAEYTSRWLSEDGVVPTADLIVQRENLTRKKIIGTCQINVLNDKPLGDNSPLYDLVASFYCTEEVALTVDRWREVIGAVCSLVRPGGHVLLSCLRDSDFYHLCNADGEVRELPCARIVESDLQETLGGLGFEIGKESVQAVTTPGQDQEGIPGVLLAFARKIGPG